MDHEPGKITAVVMPPPLSFQLEKFVDEPHIPTS
jgi:hypothetical protein